MPQKDRKGTITRIKASVPPNLRRKRPKKRVPVGGQTPDGVVSIAHPDKPKG